MLAGGATVGPDGAGGGTEPPGSDGTGDEADEDAGEDTGEDAGEDREDEEGVVCGPAVR